MTLWNILRCAYDSTPNTTAARIDKATSSLQTIDYAHHEIHAGSAYRVVLNQDTTPSGTYNVAFSTPDTTKWLHLLVDMYVEGQAELKLYEGITSWTTGAAITPPNVNRNSTNASGVTDMVTNGSLTLGSPTTLTSVVIGSPAAPGSAQGGGGSQQRSEWVLKQNTKYAVVITNQSSANNETNLLLDWYEHTDHN